MFKKFSKTNSKSSKQDLLDQKFLKAISTPDISWNEVQKLIIDKKANINAQCSAGNTALHIAASKNNVTLIDLLINNQANINAQNNSGDTPVYTALKWGTVNTILSLLEHDIDRNIQNQYGNKLLNIAVLTGDVSVLDALIQKGHDINHTNKNGISPLHSALTSSRWEVAKLLLEKGANVDAKSLYDDNTPLQMIIEYAPLEVIKSLIDHKVDINHINRHGDTALHIKIRTLNSFIQNKLTVLNEDFAKFLNFLDLFVGTDLNLNIKNQHGNTVLKFLCQEYKKLQDLALQEASSTVVNPELLSQFKDYIIIFAKKAREWGEDVTEYENFVPELRIELEGGTKSARKVAPSSDVSDDLDQINESEQSLESIVVSSTSEEIMDLSGDLQTLE